MADLAREVLKVCEQGHEIEDGQSYAPYFMAMKLANKSKYSVSDNPSFHLFVHIVGCTRGYKRSINAQMAGEVPTDRILLNACVLAYASRNFGVSERMITESGHRDEIYEIMADSETMEAMKAANEIEKSYAILCGVSPTMLTSGVKAILQHLTESESSMTFWYREHLPHTYRYLETCRLKAIREVCLSSLRTNLTSTSSTTVLTVDPIADVPESKPLNSTTAGSIDELLGFQNSHGSTSGISSSISRRGADGSVIFKTAPKSGYRIIKLDIYDYSECAGRPTQEWWQTAKHRITYLAETSQDPILTIANTLQLEMATKIKRDPSLSENRPKANGFTPFSNFSQQRH